MAAETNHYTVVKAPNGQICVVMDQRMARLVLDAVNKLQGEYTVWDVNLSKNFAMDLGNTL